MPFSGDRLSVGVPDWSFRQIFLSIYHVITTIEDRKEGTCGGSS